MVGKKLRYVHWLQERQTALHIAARLGNVDNILLLLQHGASPDSATHDLYTALHIAAKEGHEEVVRVLLDNGANQTVMTKVGLLRFKAKMIHKLPICKCRKAHFEFE
jgi:ankyrin repeat protein